MLVALMRAVQEIHLDVRKQAEHVHWPICADLDMGKSLNWKKMVQLSFQQQTWIE